MGGSLGSGAVSSRPSTTVVHFGSPYGTRYEAATTARDADRSQGEPDATAAAAEKARP